MNRLHVCLQGAAALFSIGALVFLVGCGGGPKEATNVVKGTVTLRGNPVGSATITFHGAKDVSAVLDNKGNYKIDDPPLGQVKVSIKPLPGAPMMGAEKKDVPAGADPKGAGALLETGTAVSAPKKYESPDNGLTYEVKAGKHEKNFELEP